jgi:hypothetical protein
MAAPTVEQVTEYLGTTSWTPADISSAYAAEKSAQKDRCRVPADADPWPDALAEALKRRVQHNLALRGLPLGLQASISDMTVQTTRVGGTDAEVARLEGPYRKRVVG